MTVLSPKAKNPTLQGFSDTTSPAFRQNCSKSGTHSIWLRGPDLNRRPSGYESVSAEIAWMDCTIRHGLDDIFAYSGKFWAVSSNWCVDVFPVMGQNMGQSTKRGFYLHTSFDFEKNFQVVILYIQLSAEMPTHSSTRFGKITPKNNATLRMLYWWHCFLSAPNLYKSLCHMV